MAFSHGKKAVFWLDNAAGALQNLSTYVTRVTMPRTTDVAEVSTLGDDDKEYVVGQRDGRITVEGKYDPTLDTHMAAILGVDASKTFEIGPQGGAGGAVKYTGEAILVSYEVNAGIDDAATWTAELQVTGAITKTTF